MSGTAREEKLSEKPFALHLVYKEIMKDDPLVFANSTLHEVWLKRGDFYLWSLLRVLGCVAAIELAKQNSQILHIVI